MCSHTWTSVETYARIYEQDGVAGWLTSAGSKPRMISRLGALLEESAQLLMSSRLLEECRTFITGANGKTGAAQGAHDDCLMAMAVAQAVRGGEVELGPENLTSPRIARRGARINTDKTESKSRKDRSFHVGRDLHASSDPQTFCFALSVLIRSIRAIRGRFFVGGNDLPVLAVQAIQRMRGGAQSQLMLGADSRLWVVKFQNNPQHIRVLANELIATRLADAAGLTVPASDVVEVTEWLVKNTPEMVVDTGRRRKRTLPRGAELRQPVHRRADAGTSC